jgi:hypothetical protein
MLVADIAWLKLLALPAIRAAIVNFLRLGRGGFEPAGGSEEQQRDAFDYAATFPDKIKSPNGTSYEGLVLAMNPIFWPGGVPDPAAGNEGARCKSWHYYDTPIRYHNPPPTPWPSSLKLSWAEATGRVRELALNQYSGPQFAGFSEDDLRFWWLGWLLHLAGDAHQPLHCATSCARFPAGDHGGNTFKLAQHQSLHGLWDGMLVTAAQDDGFDIASVEHANGSMSAILAPVASQWLGQFSPAEGAGSLEISAWIEEGAAAADSVVYTGITEEQAPSTTYLGDAMGYARPAVVRAGLRLAATLEQMFS